MTSLVQNDAAQRALLQAIGSGHAAHDSDHLLRLARLGLVRRGHGGFVAMLNDALDARLIADELSSEAAATLPRLEVYSALPSTQPLAEQNDGAYLAEVQTAGLGRKGRVWQAQPGANLQCSLAIRLKLDVMKQAGALSLVVAVALAEALAEAVPSAGDVAIKWPNDLMRAGGKIAGILPDLQWHAGQARVVVGFGLNLLPPEGLDQPAAGVVSEWAEMPARNRLAAALINAVVAAVQRFASQGFEPFMAAYAKRDGLLAKGISWSNSRGEVCHGQAQGVAEDGALVVCVNGEQQRLYSGSIQLQKNHYE